jgi:hypothetical protein
MVNIFVTNRSSDAIWAISGRTASYRGLEKSRLITISTCVLRHRVKKGFPRLFATDRLGRTSRPSKTSDSCLPGFDFFSIYIAMPPSTVKT